MVEIIRCSQGHRFPVNPKKDANRDYKMCPRCHERVNIPKRSKFSPNPKWPDERLDAKLRRRKPPKAGSSLQIKSRPSMGIRQISDRVAIAMALTLAAAKKAKEKEWTPVEE